MSVHLSFQAVLPKSCWRTWIYKYSQVQQHVQRLLLRGNGTDSHMTFVISTRAMSNKYVS